MFNKIAKYLFVLSGLTPILLICWLIKIIQLRTDLTFYLPHDCRGFREGIWDFLIVHWLLIVFLLCVLFGKLLLNKALTRLPIIQITAKTLKPAEVNFTPLLFSLLAGWLKFYFHDDKDLIYLVGTVFLCIIYALVFRDSYHYNIIFKVCFGYRYYEIQDGNVTYLFLSKKMIYDTPEITSGIKITDYMLIDMSDKNSN
ncbi:MAG: hypothetical protein EOO44_21265 [Flavobacterium sp.]|nr:MAG: hypothetical protein EOO44_21265 [Flavobacterium sp.]